VNLQVEGGGLTGAGNVALDLGPRIEDWEDTVAIVDQLDLVITVDTSVAHVAGALGKPVWTLLPYSPDWRWGVHGDRTVWYPSMRLFRQSRTGEWGPVIEEVLRAVQSLPQ
jgi:ADP-heptose:LPS heptosyltransferase